MSPDRRKTNNIFEKLAYAVNDLAISSSYRQAAEKLKRTVEKEQYPKIFYTIQKLFLEHSHKLLIINCHRGYGKNVFHDLPW